MSGIFTGRNPKTGEVVKEFPPDVDAYWFHHRCYIAKATENFILTSRTGIEFVDIKKSHWDINHWVRARACTAFFRRTDWSTPARTTALLPGSQARRHERAGACRSDAAPQARFGR